MKGEYVRVWKEVIIAHLNVPSQHLCRWTEESHEHLTTGIQTGYLPITGEVHGTY